MEKLCGCYQELNRSETLDLTAKICVVVSLSHGSYVPNHLILSILREIKTSVFSATLSKNFLSQRRCFNVASSPFRLFDVATVAVTVATTNPATSARQKVSRAR